MTNLGMGSGDGESGEGARKSVGNSRACVDWGLDAHWAP